MCVHVLVYTEERIDGNWVVPNHNPSHDHIYGCAVMFDAIPTVGESALHGPWTPRHGPDNELVSIIQFMRGQWERCMCCTLTNNLLKQSLMLTAPTKRVMQYV